MTSTVWERVTTLTDLRAGEWIRVDGDSHRVASTYLKKPEYCGIPVVLIRTADPPHAATYRYIYDSGGGPAFVDEHASPVTIEQVAVDVVRESGGEDAGISSVGVLGEGDLVRVDGVLHRVDEVHQDHPLVRRGRVMVTHVTEEVGDAE